MRIVHVYGRSTGLGYSCPTTCTYYTLLLSVCRMLSSPATKTDQIHKNPTKTLLRCDKHRTNRHIELRDDALPCTITNNRTHGGVALTRISLYLLLICQNWMLCAIVAIFDPIRPQSKTNLFGMHASNTTDNRRQAVHTYKRLTTHVPNERPSLIRLLSKS